MLKRIGLVLLALAVISGMLAAGKVYVDKQVGQTKAELIAGMLQGKEALIVGMLQEKEALRTEIIQKFDRDYLVEVLGREGAPKMMSDGKLDSDHNLVDLAGSNPDDLKKLQRKILVEAYYKGEKFLEGIAPMMAWVYDEGLVVGHPLVFLAQYRYWYRDLIVLADTEEGVSLKTYLLPDENQEPDLAEQGIKEELGKIIAVNPELNIVLIERVNPIIETPAEQYRSKEYKFEELAGGEAVYQLVQDGNRIEVLPTHIRGVHTDEEGRHIINIENYLIIGDLGGLVFAIRDGKFELIAITSVIGDVRVYAVDMNQIAAYIKKETGRVYLEGRTQPEETQPEEKVYTLDNYPRNPDPQNPVEIVVAFFFYLHEEKYWEAAKLVKGIEAKVESGELTKEYVINYLMHVRRDYSLEKLEKIAVKKVKEAGENSVKVTVTGYFKNGKPPPKTHTLELSKEDGGWKIVYKY